MMMRIIKRFSSLSLISCLLFLAAVFALTGCSTTPPAPGPRAPGPETVPSQAGKIYTVMGQTYRVMGSSRGFVETGMASWYGTKFHGRKTASGEIYDMDMSPLTEANWMARWITVMSRGDIASSK